MLAAHGIISREAADGFVAVVASEGGRVALKRKAGVPDIWPAWQQREVLGRRRLVRPISYHNCFITDTLTDDHTSDVEEADRIFTREPASRGK